MLLYTARQVIKSVHANDLSFLLETIIYATPKLNTYCIYSYTLPPAERVWDNMSYLHSGEVVFTRRKRISIIVYKCLRASNSC